MKSPLITMSAITGKPKREDIYRYLSSLKDNGIEQAMIYPRSGCEIEYLSEEWFKSIGDFIESAKELNMSLWLYDDFNWPSGDAGGRVTAKEEFRLKAITVKGDNIGAITCKSRHNSGLFGEKYFPDLLSAEAVDYFIQCTHEEYYKRFGEYFGTVIKGMYTDEPSIGYCCQDTSIPYYEGIDEDYFEFCNGDFRRDMVSGEKNFYLNAMTVISNRFYNCSVNRISSWCREHDILMTGHLMCDETPFHATKYGGRFLKNLSGFSLPGIDEIFTDFTYPKEMTLFGAIEYASGENGAMAELFALGPCDMTYAKKRCMICLAACHKINHYFLAISHLDLRGNMLVTDYFSNFSPDQPDFAGTKLLSNEAKIAAQYAKKDFTPDVYIRYPFSVSAKNITENLDLIDFHNLINELTYSQIQWKFIDDEEVKDAPVIELNGKMELTINNKPFDLSMIERKVTVVKENGDTPQGIFVRRFADGSLIVMNLFAPRGKYIVNGKAVFLDEYDVLLSAEDENRETKEICAAFDVSYCNDNIIRTMHINSQKEAEIYCNEAISVKIAVRKDVIAYLNGEKINCVNDADALPYGMRALYKISNEVVLKQGKSIISMEKDFKYLPGVLILGDFSYETFDGEICKLVLKSRKRQYFCEDKLSDYGKIEFTSKLIVPNGAKGIEINGTNLYTLLFVDGKLLGEKIYSPYIYPIDEDLHAKEINLKIVQFSSMAPIFGNVDYWDKKAELSQWRGTPSPKTASIGFKSISWIY